MNLNFEDHFNKELPADPVESNSCRQVEQAAFSFVTPRVPSAPKLLHVANDVADMIGISKAKTQSEEFLKTFSGALVPKDARPFSMCYGGHQFGHWAGQLGDGRAINIGEISHGGRRLMLQLKGAGATPYSRTADGLAVLRSSLREHLCSEAMFHLGVPTTRSLSLIATGDEVMRDMMYDGNAGYEPGAVVCRVAPSFIRFGNFQIFASRSDAENLQKLTDYTIRHHFPNLEPNKAGYIELLRTVAMRTLDMVIHWQRVGFVHGVMNTDNMSIHGDTIDYGPYGWLEGYDHNWTPNTTDRQNQRYRYGHQPQIALWNVMQLANALHVLVEDAAPLQEVLEHYQSQFEVQYHEIMGSKIGLTNVSRDDYEILTQLEELLQLTETDMTIFFRRLANIDVAKLKTDLAEMDGSSTSTPKPADDFLAPIMDAFYAPNELAGEVRVKWQAWFQQYVERLNQSNESTEKRIDRMNAQNPKYVLRNYMAQLAIDKAEQGDASLVGELYELLKQPYDEQPENEEWFAQRPEWARHKAGCSMLSCSS